MAKVKLTLSVNKEAVEQLKIIAIKRNTTVSQLVENLAWDLVREELENKKNEK